MSTLAAVPPHEAQGPPKLAFEQMQDMKITWKQNYPGELLNGETPHAPRYWSKTHAMLRAGHAKRYDPLDVNHVEKE